MTLVQYDIVNHLAQFLERLKFSTWTDTTVDRLTTDFRFECIFFVFSMKHAKSQYFQAFDDSDTEFNDILEHFAYCLLCNWFFKMNLEIQMVLTILQRFPLEGKSDCSARRLTGYRLMSQNWTSSWSQSILFHKGKRILERRFRFLPVNSNMANVFNSFGVQVDFATWLLVNSNFQVLSCLR